ncbi:g2864 [Coccomyxa viridis]|uniref:G2864 protein n=1 Tax=Coccomyxa viridis TaxID=1274662 RepID=A0ABP1FLE6_9CHLO
MQIHASLARLVSDPEAGPFRVISRETPSGIERSVAYGTWKMMATTRVYSVLLLALIASSMSGQDIPGGVTAVAVRRFRDASPGDERGRRSGSKKPNQIQDRDCELSNHCSALSQTRCMALRSTCCWDECYEIPAL